MVVEADDDDGDEDENGFKLSFQWEYLLFSRCPFWSNALQFIVSAEQA